MPELAYVNGTFCKLSEATVSIQDRGFQFADGVYEVVVAFGERIFRLAEHLERLKRSLEGIRLPIEHCSEDFEVMIREGIRRAGFESTLVYVQVTRGTCPRAQVATDPGPPTVVATFTERKPLERELQARGLSVCTTEDIRWARCAVKSTALLPNVMAKTEALDAGYDDAIFVAPDGEVREATAANVFVAHQGQLRTPPKSDHILHGVTRSYVLECAGRIGLPAREESIMRDELRKADEVFLCSTTLDIAAVCRVDDRPIGLGTPGPLTKALHDEFCARLRDEVLDDE